MTKQKYLHTGTDGICRCWWGHEPLDYREYHDSEWGQATSDDFQLFEKMCLEGFQAGLSWLTILRKRDHFRAAFENFNFNEIAHFDAERVAILLQNKAIVRHQGKIEATINNAHCAIQLVDEFGSLASYIWQWEPSLPEPHIGKGEYQHPIPSITQTSQALSKDLKKRGWNFFGPTTAYAFMQAMGLVNDHVEGCAYRQACADIRQKFIKP